MCVVKGAATCSLVSFMKFQQVHTIDEMKQGQDITFPSNNSSTSHMPIHVHVYIVVALSEITRTARLMVALTLCIGQTL